MFSTSLVDIPNSSDLLLFLDRISDNEGKTISIIPFGSVNNIDTLFTNGHYPNRIIKKIKQQENLSIFELESFDRSTGILKSKGTFALLKLPQYKFTYLIITIEESEFFHKNLKPFIRSFYSEIIFPFINSTDLIKLIDDYKIYSASTDIKIKRASQRIRYHEERTMSTVTWNNSSLEDAYDWLQENNGWFKSIQFQASRNRNVVSTTFVDRRGTIRTEKNFIRVYEKLIAPSCSLIETYINLFQNRARRDNQTLDIRPLKIEYSTNVFSEKESNIKFIQSLNTMANASISTLHGNPYIHLTIIDYMDASSFDLWVLSHNEILITPQLRCSIISLKRLITHIFDNYAEGKIVNYESKN